MEKAIEIKRRAQRCIQNGDLDGALTEYEKLVGAPDSDPYNYVLLADLLYKKGDPGEAAERYLAAVNAYQSASLYKNAIAVCKKMVRLSLSPAKVLSSLANLHALDGLAGEASLYYVQYAEHLVRSNAPADAAHALRKAFDVSQENIPVLEQMSESWLLAGDNTQAAQAMLEAARHYRHGGAEADAKRCEARAAALDANASEPVPAAPVVGAVASEPGAVEIAGSDFVRGAEAAAPSTATSHERMDGLESGRHFTGGAAHAAAAWTTAADYEIPAEDTPAEPPTYEIPAEDTPAEAPTYEIPADETPAYEIPADDAADEAPAYEIPADDAADEAPAYEIPADDAADAAPAYTIPTGSASGGAVTYEIPADDAADVAPAYTIPTGSAAGAVATYEIPADDTAESAPVYEIPADDAATPEYASSSATHDEPEPDGVYEVPDDTEALHAAAPPAGDPGGQADAAGVYEIEPVEDVPATAVTAHAHTGLPEGNGDAAHAPEEHALARVEELLVHAQEQFRSGERDEASQTLAEAAQVCERIGRLDNAASIYRSLGRGPHATAAMLEMWLGNCERRGELTEAGQVACELGDRALNDGDAAAARGWFERAIAFDAGNETALRRLHRLAEMGGSADAAAAAAAPKASETAAAEGRVEVAVGRAQAVSFDLAGLLAEFQRGVEAQLAGDAQSHYDLGMTYREMGLLEQAMESFRCSALDQSFAARALEMVGRCLSDQGRLPEAAEEFRNALTLPGVTSENDGELRYHYGLALAGTGRAAEALVELEATQQRLPGFEDVDQHVAELREQLGRAA